MQGSKGRTGPQTRKPAPNQQKAAPKRNVQMGLATFGPIAGFSALAKPEHKVGLKGNGFPERKHSSTMSYSPLLYEPEGFTSGGLKPPVTNSNKRSADTKGMRGKRQPPQQQGGGKKLDPIGTVSDTQSGWVTSGSVDKLSGKKSIVSNGQTFVPVKPRVSPTRTLHSPAKSVSPERLAATLTLESLGGTAENQALQFPSTKSVLPDIPHSTTGEEADVLADTLDRNASISPHRRRTSMKPGEEPDNALNDTQMLSNVTISPRRRLSLKPDMDAVEDLSSTIGSQRRVGDDLNSTVGSVGSKRRNSIKPAAVQAEKTARDLAVLDGILCGDVQQILPPQKSSIVRVFLSSTFSDFKMERNMLAQKVYPELELYCQELGLKFEVVDLRWGITDEVVNEHLVEKLCLLEVKNCKEISPNLNFVAMLGQRYGYRALPPEIEAVEFETLETIVKNENIGGGQLMEIWYKLDTNSIPPVYVLQPIKAVIPEYAEAEPVPREKGRREWDKQRSELQGCLRTAAKGSNLEEMRKDKYFISVTEQEIIAGILLNKGTVSDSFCFTRSLEKIEDHLDESLARRLMDAAQAEGRYIPCQESTELQTVVRKKIQSVLPKDNVMHYDLQWLTDGISLKEQNHLQYLDDFCENVKEKSKDAICKRSEEMKQREEDLMSKFRSLFSMKSQTRKGSKNTNNKSTKTQSQPKGLIETDFMMGLQSVKQMQQELQRVEDDNVEQSILTKGVEAYEEILHHLHFAQSKLSNFTGREKEWGKIQDYLKQLDRTRSPFLVHGAPGHGKTAFIASLIPKVKAVLQNAVVVARFLGTSSVSSSVRQIIKSLCMHICLAYGIELDTSSIARESRARVYLCDLLTIVSYQHGSSRPLVILLEAVDMLYTEGSPNSLSWIPAELPPFVGMFVSVKSDTMPHQLVKDKVDAANELHLGSIRVEDVGPLVNAYYRSKNRDVTSDQKKVVMDLLVKSPVPLYCSLVLDASLSWKSYTDVRNQALPDTIAIAMKNMFINLEGKYGPEFIKAALGYLSICNDGITEKELDDVLSMNNTVLSEAYKYHSPPTEGVVRMPPLMWARLKHDLKQYLGRKLVYGLTTVCWYYQEFMEMALDVYVGDAVRKQLHIDLVELFSVEAACLKTVTLSQRNLTIENANRIVSLQPMTAKNPRKLRCLLFHYRRSGDIYGLKRNLFLNCKYLRCFIQAFGMDDLLQTATSVQAHLKDGDIAEILRAIRFSHRQICQKPEILSSQLLCYLGEVRREKPEIERMCQVIEQEITLPALIPQIKCTGSSKESLILGIENIALLSGTHDTEYSAAMVTKGDVQVISHDANYLQTVTLERASGKPVAMEVSKDGKLLIVLFKDAVHLYGPDFVRKFSNRANSTENLSSALCVSADLSVIFLASKARFGAFENTGKNSSEYEFKPRAAMNLSGSTAVFDFAILNDVTTVSTHTVQAQKGSLIGAVICWNHQDQKISTKIGLPSLPVRNFLFVTNLAKFIICGCDNGLIFLIDSTTGKIVHDFQLKPVKTKLASFPCDFDKREELLVAAFPDKVARLWKVLDGSSTSLKVVKYADVVVSIGLNAELDLLFSGVKGGVVCNDYNADKQCQLTDGSGDIISIQCTRQSTMFSLSSDGNLKLWDTEIVQNMVNDENIKESQHQQQSGLSEQTDLQCFSFAPDSTQLMTGSCTVASSWSVENGSHIKNLDHIDGGTKMGSINVSDIPRLVVLQRDKLKVVNLDTNNIVDTLDNIYDFKAYSENLFAIGTTPDHKPELLVYDWDQHYLADSVTLLSPEEKNVQGTITGKLFEDLDHLILVRISYRDNETNCQCQIVAVQQESNGRFQQSVAVKSFKEEKFVINLGKKTVLLLDRSSSVDLWKPFDSSGTLSKVNAVQQFVKSNKLSLTGVLSRNQNILAIGSESGRVLVCGNPANDENPVKPVILKGHGNKVTSLRFLDDSRHLVSGSMDRRLMVWDVETASILQEIYTHAPSLHIQLSPDNSHLAVLAKADQGNKAFVFKIKV